MPIQLDIANIILTKEIVAKKYKGGIEQFRIDFLTVPEGYEDLHKINTEDDELFGLGQQDYDYFNFEKLALGGFSNEYIDTEQEGVAIILRYSEEKVAKQDWLTFTSAFAWHKDCNAASIAKAEKLSKITVSELMALFEKGEKPLSSFR